MAGITSTKKNNYKDQRLTKAQQKKSKAVNSAGVKNYLGEQENVTVPKKWLSSPDHVVAELAYITPREQKILLDADLYGSLKGKPNRGPGGIMSLQGAGDGGGVESDGKGGHTGTGPGKGGTGPGKQGDFRAGAQHTGLKADYGKDRTVTGDTSAFTYDGKNYVISRRPQDRQAVLDYTQGKLGFQGGKKPSYFNNQLSFKARNQLFNIQKNIKNLERLGKYRMNKLQQGLMSANIPGIDTMTMQEMIDLAPSIASMTDKYSAQTISDILSGKRSNIDFAVPSGFPSPVGLVTDKLGQIFSGPVTQEKLNELFSQYNEITNLDPRTVTTKGLMEKYEPNRYAREYGPQEPDGDVIQPYFPIDYNTGVADIDDNVADEKTFDYRFGTGQKVGRDVTLGYAADGGRITRADGGIMNVVPRQAYGLGDIVKSITKPFKGIAKAAGKVLKSDLGKAALTAAAFYYGGGGRMPFTDAFKSQGFGGFKLTGPGSFFSKSNPLLFSTKGGEQVFNPLKMAGLITLGGAAMGPAKQDTLEGFNTRGGKLIDPITGKEAVPSEMRVSLNEALDNADGDPEKIEAITNAYAFLGPDERLGTYLPYRTYGVKDGGRIRAQEGGLMNLGGMEKDYRNEGGFVPIGKEERADDVPARLSVNEFVFTADAVRNAGGGDIDKGAEVMENMMKNLENGGTVSEESQGNTGAQQMFSVSERIGEVI